MGTQTVHNLVWPLSHLKLELLLIKLFVIAIEHVSLQKLLETFQEKSKQDWKTLTTEVREKLHESKKMYNLCMDLLEKGTLTFPEEGQSDIHHVSPMCHSSRNCAE